MNNVKTILGAPGCGKTTRVLAILSEELKTTPPERIAYVSFTRKGAYEGAERAAAAYGLKPEQLSYFRTLHSIAFRTGGYSKYDMISRKDYKQFSDAMGLRLTGYYTEDFYNNDDRYMFAYFLKRNNPKTADRLIDSLNYRLVSEVERNFERYKTYAKVLDFTDIVEKFIQRGEALPVDIAIIDEAQDLTTLQWQMCEVAFANCKRIYVAGDDDQAIYEWSGADVEYFLNLPSEGREVLDKSHRLPTEILTAAKGVSSKIKRRVDKTFSAVRTGGFVSEYNDLNDLPEIKSGETWYFIARNNCFLTKYRELLRKRAVVFMDKDSKSVDMQVIKAIRLFEGTRKRGEITPTDLASLRPWLVPNVDMSLPWFYNFTLPNDEMAYYRDLFRVKVDFEIEPTAVISTIHGVKGGEADNVVISLDFTKSVKESMLKNPDSELRCLYVGMTRAKVHLHIVHSSTANGYDNFIRIGVKA